MKLGRVEVHTLKLAISLAVVRGSEVGGEIDERLPGDLWLAGTARTVEVAD